MSGKRTLVGEIVLDYLSRFPKTSNLGLAKLIFKNEKGVFDSIESARSSIRSYKGLSGKYKRKAMATRDFYDSNKWDTNNPFGIPKSESEANDPYVFDKTDRKVLMLSDFQFPYHCEQSIHSALKYGKLKGVDTIYFNGDFFDFYQGSKFVNDPRKRNMGWEIKEGKKFLHSVFNAFPNCKFYFKIGNHEERYERYLMTQAPQLLEIEEFRLDIILELRKYGCELIKSKQLVKMGKLNVLHGHEAGFSTVFPARGVILKLKDNGIIGHHHQITQFPGKDVNGHITMGYSTGCLCKLNPNFSTINQWQNGFAYIEVSKSGDFRVENKSVIKGQVF